MTDPSAPVPTGALCRLLDDRTRRAEASGALQTIATEMQVVEDEGVRFVVRSVSSLARKDRARRGSAPANPFLPPDPALTLGSVAPAHVAVLNRFNVLSHHLLLVTAAFEHQEELLTPGDFQALWWSLGELPALGFYNGGVEAGASQPHKHLQLVPLPLGDRDDLPLIARLDLDLAPAGTVSERDLPFAHAFARLPPLTDDEEAAAACHQLYRELLRHVGLAPTAALPLRQRGPYNLLATRRFLFLVPRSVERFEDISINALGFAGSLFVRTRAQLERVRQYGPLNVLRSVVP